MQYVEGFGAMTTQQAQQAIDQRSSVLGSAGSHEYPEFKLMMQSETAFETAEHNKFQIHGPYTDLTHDTYIKKNIRKLRENSRDMAHMTQMGGKHLARQQGLLVSPDPLES